MIPSTNIPKPPFLRILPIIVLGILAANAIAVPLWVVATAFSASLCIAVIFRRSEWSSWLVAGALFFFAMGATYLTLTKDTMPKGEKLIAALHITDNPQTAGRWTRATAVVERYRLAGTQSAAEIQSGETHVSEWLRPREKVILRIDTAHRVAVGDRLVAEVRLSPIADAAYEDYARLMRRRGYSASAWVGTRDSVVVLPDKARTPSWLAAQMQAAASKRLERLRLDPGELAVVKAMSTGRRQNFDPALREAYSLSGASHLLAVSGLHVGIVAMLINLLLGLLPVFRRGHMVRNVAAIAAIWLYAMMTGLSPSALRAAMMFTGVQLSLFSSRAGMGMNGLLGTAAVMLLLNPNYLYDISFQLSFAAVAGIFTLHRPLMSLVRSRWGWLNAIWSVVMIGVAATLATAPLVSYYFGRIPVIGIFINPAVIITANVIVLFALLWIIAPVGLLNGVFSTVLGAAADVQNAIVSFSSSVGWASAPVALSGWQVVFVYLTGIAIFRLAKDQIAGQPKKTFQT